MISDDLLIIHNGTVIEEDSLTLVELCRASGTHAEWIISLVGESIIEPHQPYSQEISLWRFSGTSLVRARSAFRLQRDLEINLTGIALVLDLIEELGSLRTQLNTKEHV
jgi:chaperone modulatory protein CbpM